MKKLAYCKMSIMTTELNGELFIDGKEFILLCWGKTPAQYRYKLLKEGFDGTEVTGSKNLFFRPEDLAAFIESNEPAENQAGECWQQFKEDGGVDHLVRLAGHKTENQKEEEKEEIEILKKEHETRLTAAVEKTEQMAADGRALETRVNALERELKTVNDEKTALGNELKTIKEERKKVKGLRAFFLHSDLHLWGQLLVAIVLTFFTVIVFKEFFDFGPVPNWGCWLLSSIAAICFEFSLLIFAVRKSVKWMNFGLFMQVSILGVHSGFWDEMTKHVGMFDFEKIIMSFVLMCLLPILGKAFGGFEVKK